MTDSKFWDTRSEQLKRAFLAGKAGKPGVSSFIGTRIKELRNEQGQRDDADEMSSDGGNNSSGGESAIGR